jgi:hypothetical protein
MAKAVFALGRQALRRKAHRDAAVLALDFEPVLAVAEPHRAFAFARDVAAGHLAGDAALALTQHVVDRGGDSGENFGARAVRRNGVKAVGKFLGDEASRQIAGAPARLRHQRR